MTMQPSELMAEVVGALSDLFGASQNEMVARGLPLEWRLDSAMGRAEQALVRYRKAIEELSGERIN